MLLHPGAAWHFKALYYIIFSARTGFRVSVGLYTAGNSETRFTRAETFDLIIVPAYIGILAGIIIHVDEVLAYTQAIEASLYETGHDDEAYT